MSSGDTDEEMVAAEGTDVTEYERARLERIKHNQSMLANLQVQEIATALNPVTKKQKGQSNKGKEKVENVSQRRTTRISTRTKTPTKIVDWSSASSEEESESDGAFFSKSASMETKKARSIKDEVEEDGILRRKQKDDEYEPSDTSESDHDAEADEPDDDEALQLPEKKKQGRTPRSTGKSTGKQRQRLKAVPSSVQVPRNDTDGDELDLEQAIQMSMQQGEITGEPSLKSPGAKGETKGAGASTQRKKKSGTAKLNQSEVDAFFASMVGSSNGALSLQQLENTAAAHDFIWSEDDLQDMIDVFDENDDGVLSLAEFRAMAARCKMMEAS